MFNFTIPSHNHSVQSYLPLFDSIFSTLKVVNINRKPTGFAKAFENCENESKLRIFENN